MDAVERRSEVCFFLDGRGLVSYSLCVLQPTGYARFWEMVFMDCEGQMYLCACSSTVSSCSSQLIDRYFPANLATHGSKHPCVYAKIYRDEKLKAVILEVATQAIQLGLLEICIVATVLLQSGNNID